jgi:uncharacterized protein YndB with AHSA1/START domain
MSGAPTQTIEVETLVRASPQTVFSYFVDPVKYRRWKGLEAELDPRPGGVYCVRMTADSTVRGTYEVVDPPRRLVFTWGLEGNPEVPPGSTRVEVTFIPESDVGPTLVRLRHEGLPTEDWRTRHAEGWTHYLGRLAVAAVGRDPGVDHFTSA